MVNVGAGKGDYYTENVNGNQWWMPCIEFKDGGSETVTYSDFFTGASVTTPV